MVPDVTTTLRIANAVKLTGRPKKLPHRTARRLGANLEKSQKLHSSVEK